MIIAVGLEPKPGRAQPVSGALHRGRWPEPSTHSPRTKIGGVNGITDGAYLGTPYILSLAMAHRYVRPTLFKLRYVGGSTGRECVEAPPILQRAPKVLNVLAFKHPSIHHAAYQVADIISPLN